MRLTPLLLVPLLLGPAASGAAPATQPSTRPAHDRDPWAFRCVLDGNARMIVVSLGGQRWAAYDAATCALAKVWHGDIDLTGAVYDYKHGPQPRATGAILLDRTAPISFGKVGAIATGGEARTRDLRFAGYRLKDDRVTFGFEADGLRVDETPDARATADGGTTYVRALDVTSGGDRNRSLFVELATSEHVAEIRLTEGTIVVRDVDRDVTFTAPAEIKFVTDGNVTARIDRPGRVVIETDLKASEPTSRPSR